MKKVKLTKEQREELAQLFRNERDTAIGLEIAQKVAGGARRVVWERVYELFPDLDGKKVEWKRIKEELLVGEPDSKKEKA